MGNLGHILTVPYFANYSPMHLLSYMVDYMIAGTDAFAFHLSSNIWAGIVAGFVYLVSLALIRNRIISIAAAILFILHPAHVEAVTWISSRKDLVAAAFALPCLLAYLKYRKGGQSSKWWYIASLFLFLLAVAGKLSVATFPAILLALDWFVEKRPLMRSLIDKIPFLLIGVFFALAVASAQPSSGNLPDPFVYMASLGQSLWLLTGFGSYVIYRVPPQPAAMGLEIIATIVLLAIFFMPLLLRRRFPMVVVLIYWTLLTYLPSQVLSFVHPVTDRYLFMPSVAVVILIAWGLKNISKKFKRKNLIVSSLALLIIAFFWGIATINYLGEWQDPRSVWFASLKKSNDPDIYYGVGANLLTLASQLGTNPRGAALSGEEKELLASKIWKEDTRLSKLLLEWKGGQRGGTLEKEFQSNLWKLTEDAFNEALRTKGSRAMPFLYFRLGVLFLDRGNYNEAKKNFLATIDEVSRFTVVDVGHEITVRSYSNLGYLASKQNDYREALSWYKSGEEIQTRFRGNWVPDIIDQRKKVEATVTMMSGGAESIGKTNDPLVAHSLGLYYLKNADGLGSTPRGTALPIEDAKRIATEVWKDNPQLTDLLTEWSAGQRGGPIEKIFQQYLKSLAWNAFEQALLFKGKTVNSNLFYRRGMMLGERGEPLKARIEFMAALQEVTKESNKNVQQEITVMSHDALGILAWQEKNYKEALQWFRMARQEQISFGGTWVPDIDSKCKQMETMTGSSKTP
jgi:tetratricopeptide (TPR) repeat protein